MIARTVFMPHGYIDTLKELTRLGAGHWISLLGAGRCRRHLSNVETYLMFIGSPSSGHSIVGALLDAQPEIVCAYEQNALKYVLTGFNRRQLFWLLLENSRRFARSGSRSSGYRYAVSGSWQGRFRTLRAIGDKQGQGATLRLYKRPWLMGRLRRVVGVPVRGILVTRNPFDNIATIARRDGIELADAAARYLALCRRVAWIRRTLFDPREVMELEPRRLYLPPGYRSASSVHASGRRCVARLHRPLPAHCPSPPLPLPRCGPLAANVDRPDRNAIDRLRLSVRLQLYNALTIRPRRL